jgi:Na+-transporting NADH:ubiquinone oxidoreductase subunit NqrD
MAHQERPTTALKVVGIVFYVLAAIVFVLGAFLGLGFANARSAIRGATIAFQSPALNPLWDTLASGLTFIGVVLFVMSLIVSSLLVASGLLLRRSLALSRRVRQLEAALERANIPIAAEPVAQTAPREPDTRFSTT